ncbi:MAG: hypothetical protein HY401_08795 [Elusimicrobia bacterium]|nr:hypothetical protein [Elusimicrobiota bacterium]
MKLVLLYLSVLLAHAQEEPPASIKDAPRVFLDCRASCDKNYIKTEIKYVNFVRERQDADIHVLLLDEPTGGGGKKYTFQFIGQNKFAGKNEALSYASKPLDTGDELRKRDVQHLNLGLLCYVGQSPIKDSLKLDVKLNDAAKLPPEKDKWNNWAFATELNGYFNAEETTKSGFLYGTAAANRVTEELKAGFSAYAIRQGSSYEIAERTVSKSDNQYGWSGLVVASVDSHWSAGGWADLYSSRKNNTRLAYSLMPAVEYNVFPYKESTKKEFRFLYKAGISPIRYHEETVEGKTRQTTLQHSLSSTLKLKDKWGNVEFFLKGSQYWHDLSKARLNFSSKLALNVAKKLQLTLEANASLVKDQINLPKSSLSDEDILLGRRELPTSFYYGANAGVRFTFGSIFNNIVNPRFGN